MRSDILFAISIAVLLLAFSVQRILPPTTSTLPPARTPFPPSSTATRTQTPEPRMGNKSMKPDSAAADAKRLVEDSILAYPVVIFSKSYCPYCTSAKADIRSAGAEVTNFAAPKTFELDRMGASGLAIQAYLEQKTGRRSVPNVFIGGVTVGGGDEVASYANRNVLKQMLTQAPDRLAASRPAPAEPVETAETVVENAIKENPVVVFSKSYCPYCKAAKEEIARSGAFVEGFPGAEVFELDQLGTRGDEILAYLAKKTGRRTVPNVFIGGTTVGGGDDVTRLAAAGGLVPAISDAVGGPAALGADGAPAAEEDATAEDPAAAEAAKLVEEAIAGNSVAVFSKSYCPYCISAKSTLAAVGQDVSGYQPAKVFELDDMGSLGQHIQRYLAEKTGRTTVPNVFIAGKNVGGGDDVSALAASGELKQMLENASSVAMKDEALKTAPSTKEIIFGAGCFWGVELAFQRVVGVLGTEVGYSNGRLPRVTYDAVCSGLTGSAEVVRVTYDPAIVSIAELLAVWESRHDPTSMNKQGNDVGTQYRSAVFFNDEEQKAAIEKWQAEASARLSKPIVSEIAPVNNYCAAEDYHQKYLEKKGQSAEKGSATRIRCYG